MNKKLFYILYIYTSSHLPSVWLLPIESYRSPQMYDPLSAYFTNRVIRLLRNGICVFKFERICSKETDRKIEW